MTRVVSFLLCFFFLFSKSQAQGLSPGASVGSREAYNIIAQAQENARHEATAKNNLDAQLGLTCDRLNKEIKVLLADYSKGKSPTADRLRRMGPIIPSDLPQLPVHEIANGKVGYPFRPDGWPSRQDAQLASEDSDSFRVVQVIDENNMLVSIHGKTTWIKGVATAGIVDDSKIPLIDLFFVNGTKRYLSAMGGNNTVFVLEAIHFDKAAINREDAKAGALSAAIDVLEGLNISRLLEKQNETEKAAQKEKALAAAEVARWRTWTDSEKRFSVKARFSGVANGTVQLKRESGKMISVPLEKLSKEDREWIANRK